MVQNNIGLYIKKLIYSHVFARACCLASVLLKLFYTKGVSLSEKMRITEVGIGTINPSAKLHVANGHIKTTQTTSPTIAVVTGIGAGSAISINGTDWKIPIFS